MCSFSKVQYCSKEWIYPGIIVFNTDLVASTEGQGGLCKKMQTKNCLWGVCTLLVLISSLVYQLSLNFPVEIKLFLECAFVLYQGSSLVGRGNEILHCWVGNLSWEELSPFFLSRKPIPIYFVIGKNIARCGLSK